MPTYSPKVEADKEHSRSYLRLSNQEISSRMSSVEPTSSGFRLTATKKPWVYFDAIDSILNTRPDIELIVADGRSTDSIRNDLTEHHKINCDFANYHLELYPERMSQWIIFNDIYHKYAKEDTKYFVYSSSDVIWKMDWIAEAIKEFEKNPKLMILFPTVSSGDGNLPCQVAQSPQDIDPFQPPYQDAAKAPVLNGYVMIYRMEFLKAYDGYPTLFRNCYTESFIHFLLEAIGGEQRLLPRGWCWHWGTVDIWEENGSFYHYNEDMVLFQDTMNKLRMAQGLGLMNKEFLKKLLWK